MSSSDWFGRSGPIESISANATLILTSTLDPADEATIWGLVSNTYYRPQIVGFDWAIWYVHDVLCPGDLDNSDSVNLADLTILLAHYGLPGKPSDGDMDENGLVNLEDLVILLSNFGFQC